MHDTLRRSKLGISYHSSKPKKILTDRMHAKPIRLCADPISYNLSFDGSPPYAILLNCASSRNATKPGLARLRCWGAYEVIYLVNGLSSRWEWGEVLRMLPRGRRWAEQGSDTV